MAHGLGGALVVVVFFGGTLWALDTFLPSNPMRESKRPALPQLPPLPPVTRTSVVIAPVAVANDRHPRRAGRRRAAQSRPASATIR